MIDAQRLDSALVFAARAHTGQVRKSTDVPYLVHPVGVMLVLMECGITDTDILSAALLHDTVEDTPVTLAQLREVFGEQVAAIVEGCSEPDKSDTWEHRKEHTIAYLRTASREIALVSAADKLHNLRSMVLDYAAQGDTLWSRFKRGRDSIAWYYRSIVLALQQSEARDETLIHKLSAETDKFFGPG
jgi:(p)ppGpp synthase/HD superfamily hydrolase